MTDISVIQAFAFIDGKLHRLVRWTSPKGKFLRYEWQQVESFKTMADANSYFELDAASI